MQDSKTERSGGQESPESSKTLSPIARAFLSEVLRDSERGAPLPLHHYMGRFPDHALEIADLYANVIADPESYQAPLQRVGPYRIVSEIGRGGYGVVYLAEDTRLPRRVALKLLRYPASGEGRERLYREAAATAKISDPAICPVYEVGEHGHQPYLAMQYVEGVSLDEHLASWRRKKEAASSWLPLLRSEDDSSSSTQTPRSAAGGTKAFYALLEFFERMARGLHAAHRKGIVHRDLKPGNVMVTPEGRPVILDFGLAQDHGGNQGTLTATGAILGTPAYMAPEQIRGQGPFGPETDIHAFGAMLYECLTGERPFKGTSREGLFRDIMEGAPRPARRLNRRISKDLDVLLRIALDKEPAQRYHDAGVLAEDLERARTHRPLLGRRASAFARTLRWARRNPGVAAALMLLTALSSALVVSSVALSSAVKRESAAHTRGRQVYLASIPRGVTDPKLRLALARMAAAELPGIDTRSDLYKAIGAFTERTDHFRWSVRTVSLFDPTRRHVVCQVTGGSARGIYVCPLGKEPIRLPISGHHLLSLLPDGLVVTRDEAKRAALWTLEGTRVPFEALEGSGKVQAAIHRPGTTGGLILLVDVNDDGVARRRVCCARPGALRFLDGELDPAVTHLVASPDGRHVLAFGQGAAKSSLLSLEGSARRKDFVGKVKTAAWSSGTQGSESFAVGTLDGLAFVFDGAASLSAQMARQELEVPGAGRVHSVAFHPNGHDLVVGYDPIPDERHPVGTGIISFSLIDARWTPRNTTYTDNLHRAVSWVMFDRSGEHFVACGRSGMGNLFRFADGALLHQIAGVGSESVAWWPDESLEILFAGWHVFTSQPARRKFWSRGGGITALTRFGGRVALGTAEGWLHIMDVDSISWREEQRPIEFRSGIRRLTPCGTRTLALGHEDGTVSLWTREKAPSSPIAVGSTGAVRELLAVGDRYLAVLNDDGVAALIDLASHRVESLNQSGNHVQCLAVAGMRVATGDREGSVRIWPKPGAVSKPKELPETVGTSVHGGIFALLFSPDETSLLAFGWDRWGYILKAGEEPTKRHGELDIGHAHYLANRRHLVTVGRWQPSPALLDAETLEELPVLAPRFQGPDATKLSSSIVTAVRARPDGERLLLPNFDGTVVILDARTGDPWALIQAHGDIVHDAIYTEDGRWIVTVSQDGSARLWPDDPIEFARRLAPEDFPQADLDRYYKAR